MKNSQRHIPLKFGEGGQAEYNLYMLQIQNGKHVVVWPPEVARAEPMMER